MDRIGGFTLGEGEMELNGGVDERRGEESSVDDIERRLGCSGGGVVR